MLTLVLCAVVVRFRLGLIGGAREAVPGPEVGVPGAAEQGEEVAGTATSFRARALRDSIGGRKGWAHKARRLGLWSFVAAAALLGISLESALALYLLYIGVSLALGAVAGTTLAWMLHAWRTPSSLAESRLDCDELSTTCSFSLIVPARHEEAVLEVTLTRLVQSDHPDFEVLVVVGDDDPATREVAERTAALYPELVKVVIDGSRPKNKPKALNAALRYCAGTVTGVFDAEDDVHPALLRRVDQCFQRTNADVVQAGVQLMNFRSSWLTVRNVLEYYFWFRSRLHLHARQGFIPLGGNTVFVRTEVLRSVSGWDPDCLAEDCELGVRLSSLGARTAVFYDPELVTREECPPTLRAFVRQRTRWNQGYLQTLARGYWRRLPLRHRALGAYVLTTPYLLAVAWAMIPIAIGTAVTLKAPIVITLISFLPAVPIVSTLGVEIAGLGDFCRTYGERPSMRDYVRLVVGLPLYQAVLSFAAARAAARELRGERGWEKTTHLGLHLKRSGDEELLPAHELGDVDTEQTRTITSSGGMRTRDGYVLESGATAGSAGNLLVREEGKARGREASAPAGNGDHEPSRLLDDLFGAVGGEPLWVRLNGVSANGSITLSPPHIPRTRVARRLGDWLARAGTALGQFVKSHVDLVVQIPLLASVAFVEGTNLLHWPAWQFDEGTYTGYAWALQHGRLAPYTFGYGHPPLAWLIIALWTWASGIVGNGVYSIDTGRELMLVISIVSCSLVYTLARRLNLSRAFAVGAVILFGFCPLGLFFHRAVLLDNPAIAWALAAFVLALTPQRRLWAFAGSGACFAAAVLAKETTLVLLPALLVAVFQNADRHSRRYCLTLSVSFFALIALTYPLYATLKGELLPGPGHVSLVGTTIVQLFTRQSTGSIFNPHTIAHQTVVSWLQLDPWLVGAAVALSPIALARRSTRAVALAFLIQVMTVLRPGYLPNMYVTGMLPFAALIVVGSLDAMWRFVIRHVAGVVPFAELLVVRGFDAISRLIIRRHRRPRLAPGESIWKLARRLAGPVLTWTAVAACALGLLASALVAAHVAPRWVQGDRVAMTTRQDGPERAAERWLVTHVGHNKRLIVGDEIWIYLIEHGFDAHPMRGGFFSRTVVSYWPLDYDPAVKRAFPHGWRDFDYVVSTLAMRVTTNQTPTTAHALIHSRVVAQFGSGPALVQIRAINR
jgi:cellulose synthase/poly-beta-1,6-N-acetylglucosamine synthase-like glycosyltransferase/4-amino-4-deoxy-L-arabinose transferase-like glycosyltransferase